MFLRDFADKRHAVTTEGVATLQCPQQDAEQTQFGSNWKTGPHAAAYLPIYALALHEDWFLSDRRVVAVEAQEQDKLLAGLEAVIDDAMMFDLYYRFPFVSQITMHQRFADAVRNAFKLDQKFASLQAGIAP